MSKGRILVIDDERDIHKICESHLGSEGYMVDGVINLKEALAKIADTKYDLMFIDLFMPELNGIEIVKKLKKLLPDTPMVLITGKVKKGLIESEVEFAEAGGIVKYFLYKPFGKDEILLATRKALAKNNSKV